MMLTQFTAKEKITRAKIQLLKDNPFFGYLVCNLNVKETNDMPMKTACVDAFGNMFYDKDFIESISVEQCKTVICHEVSHVAFQHLTRLKGRDRDIANIAMDVVVNNLLVNSKFEMIKGTIIPENDEIDILDIHISNISKKTYEQVYDELMPLVNQKKKREQEIKELLNKLLDEHKFSSGGGKDEKELTPQQKQLIEQWKEMLASGLEFARQRGNVPAGMERYIKTILDQKLDWKSLLYRYIVRELPSNYSYNVINKRSISQGYAIPGVIKENMRIVVHIDTSGSIQQQELDEFLAEVVGIARSFNNIEMTLIICDCSISEVIPVSNGHIEDIFKLKIKGGGGTSHKPVIKYIEDEMQDVKLLISLTDGYSDIERLSPPPYNVIFAISKNGVKKEFGFGETIFLED